MKQCIRDYNVIYSQPSIEAFEILIKEMVDTFGLYENIDDMFYYGVFCKPETYANYHFSIIDNDEDFDVPYIFNDCTQDKSAKLNYIQNIIGQIMRKEIEKPNWMKFIELNYNSNEFAQPPSTFLYIQPKEKQYERLAICLTNFLYSPNLNITMFQE